MQSWFIRKDPDAGKDWGQEEKRVTEDEVVGQRHQLNGHELEQTGRQWKTAKPGMLQSMVSQKVGLDLATEQQQYAGNMMMSKTDSFPIVTEPGCSWEEKHKPQHAVR